VPFRDVYITGLVRDKDGQKMSKSKGNVLDPLDLIDGISLDALLDKRTGSLMQPQMAEKIARATRKEFPNGIPAFGADALRFTFASLAGHGRDIKFDLNRCEGYKNFCNKLWNAARFVLMNCEGFTAPAGAPQPRTDAERWILARLATTINEVDAQFAAYRFDLVAQALYEFTWNDLCDWFLELAKPALQGDDTDAAASTRHTLLYVLEAVLRLLHPLVPFVTEEIWHTAAPKLGMAGDTISLRPWPTAAELGTEAYADAAADMAWLQAVVVQLRRIRSELNVPPSKAVRLLLAGGDATDAARIARHSASLRFLGRLDSIAWHKAAGDPPPAAAGVVGELRLLIPLQGLVDLDAERARLDRELKRVAAEIAKCEGKLGNERFVANAPDEVVAQERERLGDWSGQLAALREQRERLG
jgi:valyl-tRNA synthetase